jgi:7,8-dihydropterin-6-yl-methyl-4-(beta-D-ribofuranosyl)aminobenzene 5'-phosphate synthase
MNSREHGAKRIAKPGTPCAMLVALCKEQKQRISFKEEIMLIQQKIIAISFLFFFVITTNSSLSYPKNETDKKEPIKMTILYDNYIFTEGTKSDWGFACLIEGFEKTILFDTGTKSNILWYNVDKLNADLSKVEQIVISHNHHDHTGGLQSVLEKNPDVSVFLPVSFAHEFVSRVEGVGAKVVAVDEPQKICENVHLTGEMGDQIKEQSLILDTSKGLVIVTGCSHQGIVNILKIAKQILNKDIYLVFGGFHLMRHSEEQVKEIIQEFKNLGVKQCGATHCTGDDAIALFKEAFGENYVQMGVGKVISEK